MMIECIDLFCGAGGVTMGLTRAGIGVVLGVDADPAVMRYALQAGARRVECARVSEIDTQRASSLFSSAAVRMIHASPPCQNFSSAKSGAIDLSSRSLVMGVHRVALDVGADIVTIENVPRFATSKECARFIDAMHESGYHVLSRVHNAADFGVPQHRLRTLIVCAKFPLDSLEILTSERVSLRDSIGHMIETDESVLHRASSCAPHVIERMQHTPQGGDVRDLPIDIMPPRARAAIAAGKKTYWCYRRPSWHGQAGTVTSHYASANDAIHPIVDRPFTPAECAVIQGFNPSHFNGISSRDRAMTMIANAVPPPMAEALGRAIIVRVARHYRSTVAI